MEFEDEPSQAVARCEIPLNRAEKDLLRSEVKEMLRKGLVHRVAHMKGEFISNIFLREEREHGKYRMIFNLSGLNEFLVKQHFKMDIAPEHRKFLSFFLDGVLYGYINLAQGL